MNNGLKLDKDLSVTISIGWLFSALVAAGVALVWLTTTYAGMLETKEKQLIIERRQENIVQTMTLERERITVLEERQKSLITRLDRQALQLEGINQKLNQLTLQGGVVK